MQIIQFDRVINALSNYIKRKKILEVLQKYSKLKKTSKNK